MAIRRRLAGGADVDSGEGWVGGDDMAARLGVGRDSASLWAGKRRLPRRKLGCLLCFKLSNADAWVEARSGEGNGPAEPQPRSRRVPRKKGGGR